MRRLSVDQKLLSLRSRYTVDDEAGQPVYNVEGSLFRIPKQFTISDLSGNTRTKVTKQLLSWLPIFHVEVDGVRVASIRQNWTFWRKSFSVIGPDIEVRGDVWNMNFGLFRGGMPIGRVDQKWFTIRDRFSIEINDLRDEFVVLGICLAIDYAKQQAARASASSSS